MAKQVWEPCSILSPVPAVLVTVRGKSGQDNVLTIAWCGTVCSSPAMVSISVRKERFSYEMLRESGEFVINLVTEDLVRAADYCGVRSGKTEDKFRTAGLTKAPASKVSAPLISESPVNIECRVTEVRELGSHDLFLAEGQALSGTGGTCRLCARTVLPARGVDREFWLFCKEKSVIHYGFRTNP